MKIKIQLKKREKQLKQTPNQEFRLERILENRYAGPQRTWINQINYKHIHILLSIRLISLNKKEHLAYKAKRVRQLMIQNGQIIQILLLSQSVSVHVQADQNYLGF
ncbi:unnamed protein product [Paramecium sonneborni]|uniref:Uncharacterized protein n=1 Tax=Paramecium sonneborni TaxID=65129 RepID=A0A8S1RPZ7_9CILI|nr:unnamed protein product [Paramecium sonneborni]